jgi:hypothetical protein
MKTLLIIISFGFLNTAFGQVYSALEKVLTKEFSKDSQKDGRWVFYADKAKIQKLDKSSIKASFPNYDLFQVTLTNYLGWHINQGTCMILFDSLKSKIILVEPLWYSGISEPFAKLFIGRKFDNKDSLLNFINGVNELMGIGSGYRFRNTGYTDSLITYVLGYFKGDTYTTDGNGTSSTVRYNEDGIWRKIKIEIDKFAIIRYTSINPKTNDKEVIQ